jgi:hypothetical protein
MNAFVERYGSRRVDAIGNEVVADWLAGGKRNGTVPALRAMFNDAASAKAGRLVQQNPFARLGISKERLARHLRKRRDRALREMPIPLGPSGRLAVGEIERIDDVSALPAVVRHEMIRMHSDAVAPSEGERPHRAGRSHAEDPIAVREGKRRSQ